MRRTFLTLLFVSSCIGGCTTNVGVIQTGPAAHASVNQTVDMKTNVNVGVEPKPNYYKTISPLDTKSSDSDMGTIKTITYVALGLGAAGLGSYLAYDGFDNYHPDDLWQQGKATTRFTEGMLGSLLVGSVVIGGLVILARADKPKE